MTFSTWSQTAASNTSVGGISTDGTVTLVKQIDNMFRGMMAELAVARDDGTITAIGERGYLFGLTMSNSAGDLTNDIDIAVGECAAENSPYWKIALASVLTKRLDAAWAVGTNQGGLDTGSIANTTYHVWLIARSDTGVVDALFSTSATSPTMPANYDRKRRIGSIIRASAAIIGFFQRGDLFLRTGAIPTQANVPMSITTPFLINVSVPTGIKVGALLRGTINNSTSITNAAIIVSSPDEAVGSPTFTSGYATAICQVLGVYTAYTIEVSTNTSSQVRIQCADTTTNSYVSTHGWIDTRGRLA